MSCWTYNRSHQSIDTSFYSAAEAKQSLLQHSLLSVQDATMQLLEQICFGNEVLLLYILISCETGSMNTTNGLAELAALSTHNYIQLLIVTSHPQVMSSSTAETLLSVKICKCIVAAFDKV